MILFWTEKKPSSFKWFRAKWWPNVRYDIQWLNFFGYLFVYIYIFLMRMKVTRQPNIHIDSNEVENDDQPITCFSNEKRNRKRQCNERGKHVHCCLSFSFFFFFHVILFYFWISSSIRSRFTQRCWSVNTKCVFIRLYSVWCNWTFHSSQTDETKNGVWKFWKLISIQLATERIIVVAVAVGFSLTISQYGFGYVFLFIFCYLNGFKVLIFIHQHFVAVCCFILVEKFMSHLIIERSLTESE